MAHLFLRIGAILITEVRGLSCGVAGALRKGIVVMRVHQRVKLPKNIAAIHLRAAEDGEPRLGYVSPIPQGAELRVCGGGFNTRTVKVNWNGGFYFVFLQDIEPPERGDLS